LPLAILAAKSGLNVFGIDNNESKVSSLNQGISPVDDLSDSDLVNVIKTNRYRATTEYKEIANCGIVVICVPTPLTASGLPDLSYLHDSITNVCKHVQEETLIIIESTVAPGTTREYVSTLIEEATGNPIGHYKLAFSPERVDPKNSEWNVRNTPKLVSGLTVESCEGASDFYSGFIENIIVCNSMEVAETAKLLENSFRLVNISLINEIGVFCQKIGIDVNDVVRAAATKPYGFMPFYPSLGAGGHCIPVDPIYLAEKASNLGNPIQMIEMAAKVNSDMPIFYIDKAKELLGGLSGKRILVVGVAYKPNIADTRETPALSLVQGLRSQGAAVIWHDDLVFNWIGEKSVPLNSECDLAIIATQHDYLDLTILGSTIVLNTKGIV
jgi:UDP-N-acetyl-D-glucosamine dehydrogenase